MHDTSRSKWSGEEFPGEKEGAWLVMASPGPHITAYAFYQPILGYSSGAISTSFQGLLI